MPRNSIRAKYSTFAAKLARVGYKKRYDAIRHQIYELDKEACNLIYDNNAYLENRKKAWDLTSELLKEVR